MLIFVRKSRSVMLFCFNFATLLVVPYFCYYTIYTIIITFTTNKTTTTTTKKEEFA